jgi:ubiquinone/menaquinone biosynthesis C-methylase UbiE
MSNHPVAAGKSSIDLIDRELAFAHIVSADAATYLDLACGAGRYALPLAERVGPGRTVYALDLWAEGVAAVEREAARLGLANLRAMRADATLPLPLEDDAVDVCLMATILHDLPPEKRAGTLAEVRRVLAPRGALVLIEFKKRDAGPGPRKELRVSAADALALLAPLGFAEDVALDLGEFTYLARFSLK